MNGALQNIKGTFIIMCYCCEKQPWGWTAGGGLFSFILRSLLNFMFLQSECCACVYSRLFILKLCWWGWWWGSVNNITSDKFALCKVLGLRWRRAVGGGGFLEVGWLCTQILVLPEHLCTPRKVMQWWSGGEKDDEQLMRRRRGGKEVEKYTKQVEQLEKEEIKS